MPLRPERIAREFDILMNNLEKMTKIFKGKIKTGPPGRKHRSIFYCEITFEYDFIDNSNYKLTLKFNDTESWRESQIPYKNEYEINWTEFFKDSFDFARTEYSRLKK